jgi:hypothetical protein
MRAIQGTFPRLKVPLPTDAVWRHDILDTAFRLFNVRTRYTRAQLDISVSHARR